MNTQQGKTAARQRTVSSRSSSGKQKRAHKRYRLKASVRRKLAILGVLAGLIVIALLLLWLWPAREKRIYHTVGVQLQTVNGIEVVHDYIPEGHQNRPGIQREIRWIVIHETDNEAASADAWHHNEYLKTNETDINSWHYTVDDHAIYHSLPDEEVGWHAGDKMTENGGNMTGIGIELCVNEGNDFEKTMENAAALCAELMKAYDLRIEDIKQHHDFSGKDCPHRILSADRTEEFVKMVQEATKP